MSITTEENNNRMTFTFCTYCERVSKRSKSETCPHCREIKINKLFGIVEI
jgi:hypothetical protein